VGSYTLSSIGNMDAEDRRKEKGRKGGREKGGKRKRKKGKGEERGRGRGRGRGRKLREGEKGNGGGERDYNKKCQINKKMKKK